MPVGNDGDSKTLTVHDAGPLLDRFLSPPSEDKETPEDTPAAEPAEEAPAAEAPDDEPAGEAGDEPEAGEGDEGQPADEEDAPAAARNQPDDLEEVTVDGKTERVTKDELKKGYSREASYTRKSQALSEERKAFDAEKTSVSTVKAQLSTRLTEIENILKAQYQEPDWNKLQAENPDQFAATHAAWQIHKDRMAVVATERARLDKELAAEQVKQINARLDNETQQLLAKLPEWKDEAVRSELHAWTLKQGYSAQEVDGLSDHRTLLMLRKAMLYDKAQATAQQKTQTAKAKLDKVRAATPGSTADAKSKPSALTRSKQRLAKSGNVRDAGEALNTLFGF